LQPPRLLHIFAQPPASPPRNSARLHIGLRRPIPLLAVGRRPLDLVHDAPHGLPSCPIAPYTLSWRSCPIHVRAPSPLSYWWHQATLPLFSFVSLDSVGKTQVHTKEGQQMRVLQGLRASPYQRLYAIGGAAALLAILGSVLLVHALGHSQED